MGRSSCFGCERRKGVLTVEPIRALRACGVEEVHQTLFREGFDLAGFFKRYSTLAAFTSSEPR